MSRLDELIEALCPDGVPFKTLGSIVQFSKGKTLPASGRVSGPYPVVTAGRTAAFHHSNFNTDGPAVTIASHGDAGFVNYWPGPIWLANNVFLLTPRDAAVLPRFLYSALKTVEKTIQAHGRGGGVPYFNSSDIASITIPVPPLEVQEEVVRILDLFTTLEAELAAELAAELEARRKQYEYYRDRLLTFKELES